MTLNDTVLQKAADWRPPGSGRQTLVIPDEGSGWAVSLTADRNDELGCLVWEVGLRYVGAADRGTTLGTWAAAAAERVTGLLQPLKVLEVDKQRNEALLRNDKAVRKGDAVSYYEVLLKGTTEALLRRYLASAAGDQRRQQVAFPATHEALAQVVADLALDQ